MRIVPSIESYLVGPVVVGPRPGFDREATPWT